MTKDLIPKIRFKGYTEAWEQRKLDYFISDLKSGLSRMLSDADIGLPVVRANNINDCILDLNHSIKYWYLDDPQGANTSNYFISKNDILINFINSEAKMGTAAIVENTPKRPTIYTTNILRMKLNNNGNSNFFLAQSLTDRYKTYIKGISKIAVNQASFTTVDFKNYDLIAPSVTEQNKIGDIFKNIDNLITLHQRKYDKLVELKKSLLEKMFPKNNLLYPETRFNGFTEAWEQRKLEDIGDYFSTGTLGYADLKEDGKYKCVLYGDLYTKFNERIFDVKSRTNTDATKVEINDILFPTSTTVDNISLIAPSCVNQANLRVGGDLFGVRPYKNIDGNFISYCINNFMPVKYSFAKQAQGLTIVHLQYNAVKNEKLMLPSIKEQNRMSQLFINIDNLITLHQRKHEKLIKIKASLLNDMFV